MKRNLRHLCGTAREHVHGIGRYRSTGATSFELEGAYLGPITRWVRDQGVRPSCGAQATSAMIEVIRPDLPRISAVDIWRGARRRLGLSLSDLSQGTRWSAIFAELDLRGVDDWHPGEDEDPVEGGRGAPKAGDNLRDEMRAADRRGLFAVSECRTLADIEDALVSGYGVGASFGCRDPFLSLGRDEVATSQHLGGNSDGHAMRIVGYCEHPRYGRVYIGLNSWGTAWGGCTVNDRDLRGHFLMTSTVMSEAWNVWALKRKA